MMWYHKYDWNRVDPDFFKDESASVYNSHLAFDVVEVLEGKLKSGTDPDLEFPHHLQFYIWEKEIPKTTQWHNHNQDYECNCADCLAEGNHGNTIPRVLMYVLRFPPWWMRYPTLVKAARFNRFGPTFQEQLLNFTKISNLGPIVKPLMQRPTPRVTIPYLSGDEFSTPLPQLFATLLQLRQPISLNYPAGFRVGVE